MKLNEKIDLIRETLSADIKPINTKYILDNAQITPLKSTNKRFSLFSPKLGYLFASILIFIIIIPLALSQFGLNRKANDNMPSSAYNNEEEVYAYAISSTIALIKATNNLYNNLPTPSHNNELLVYHKVQILNYFLQPIDMMLSHDQFIISRKSSDRSGFAYKITVEGVNILNEDINYTIYFNITNYNQSIDLLDFLVNVDDNTYSFQGEKRKLSMQTIFQLTYAIDENNYIQVTKDLTDVNDSFAYLIVIDDVIISNIKLTLTQNNDIYCKLEDLTSEKLSTIFYIYPTSISKFFVDYSIFELSISNEGIPDAIVKEEGQINIEISKDASVYTFKANNSNIIIGHNKEVN